MTPGARLQSAIELLSEIGEGHGAADDVVGGFFRRHRFVGAKDRNAISEHIYAILRHRASIDWWIRRVNGNRQPDARQRLFATLILVEGWEPDAVARACDGDRFRPNPLGIQEQEVVQALKGKSLSHPEMPRPVRLNYPDWLDAHWVGLFGDRVEAELNVMTETAPLDLRVNRLKANRADARSELTAEGVDVVPTPLAPTGLRVHKRIPLATLEVFKSGRIEVQDEGSQLAALLALAKPGMRVVDFCAGAGGKTLAIAAGMQNKGHLVACDISEKRLERAVVRLRRAGVSNVERKPLSSERDKWVKRHAESFDRVFVDAPCTGTGTWRRNPDAKWRLRPSDLEELTALQASILDSAARLVKAGGRLVYATCSMLPAENDGQVAAFLAGHPHFRLVPMVEVWKDAIGTPCPVATETLQLTPAQHGTDGFFVAVMERLAAKPASELEPVPEQDVETSTEPPEVDAA